jgi:hypothetical protein
VLGLVYDIYTANYDLKHAFTVFRSSVVYIQIIPQMNAPQTLIEGHFVPAILFEGLSDFGVMANNQSGSRVFGFAWRDEDIDRLSKWNDGRGRRRQEFELLWLGG